MQQDGFTELDQAEFDGVVFPVVRGSMRFGSAVARHKWPHRPGQKLEPTGREPVVGSMLAPMFATLPFEGNGRNVFWPTGVQLLREKAQQQKIARLVVPTYGTIERAMIWVDEAFDATAREGAWLTITFEEDSGDTIEKGTAGTASSRIPQLALDLDAHMAALKLAAQQRIEDLQGNTHLDFVSACEAFLALKDQAEQSALNRVAMATRIVGALDDVFRTAASTFSDPVGWEAREALLDLKLAMIDAGQEASAMARAVTSFTVEQASTVQDVASATLNTIEEVLELNVIPDPTDIASGEVVLVYARK